MALTPDQKAKIKERATSLVQGGTNTQDAIKQAFDEIGGAGSLEATIQSKVAPALGPVATKPLVTKEQIATTDDSKLSDDLRSEENKFVRLRRDELKALGYTDTLAVAQAQREANDMFGQTMSSGFGDFKEKTEAEKLAIIPTPKPALPPYLRAPEEPTLATALRPQTFTPTSGTAERIADKEKLRFTTSADALQSDISPSGAGIDWTIVKEMMAEGSDATDEQINDELDAVKAAYDQAVRDEVDRRKATKVPYLDKVIDDSADAQSTSLALLQQAIKEVGSIQDVKPIRSASEDAAADKLTQGTDPASTAFSKQVVAGAGIPDYTPAQRAYIRAKNKKAQDKELADRLAGNETKEVYTLRDGTQIPADTYQEEVTAAAESGQGIPGRLSGAKKGTVLRTEAEIRKELDKKYEQPFYLDESSRAAYFANPEKYMDTGILYDTTIYGGQKETTTGWLMRSALSPLNAVAGLVAPMLFEGLPGSEVKADIAERKRERRPELYKDSPILLNIAENRGFLGEGIEVANILGLEGPTKYAYLGGTLAADLLDPSLDVLRGATTASKVAVQAQKASKALGALDAASKAGRLSESAVAGLRAGLNDVLDTSFISVLTKRKLDSTSPRIIATSDLTRSLEESQKVADELVADPSISSVDMAGKLGDSGYATKWKAGAQPGKSAKELADELAAAMGQSDVLTRADDVTRGLDEIASTGATRKIRSKEVSRALGAMAATDANVAATFKRIDGALDTTKNKFSQYVSALDPTQRDRLRRGLLHDIASTEVFNNTKNMSSLDNLVAATKNTFVDKNILPRVMEAAGASEIGQIAKSLEGAPIVFKNTRNRGIQQAYEISEDTGKRINAVLDQLRTFRKGGVGSAPLDVGRGYILTSDLRAIIDANIDMIAEGIAVAGKEGVVRARDVARLPISKQLDLLVPLESRAFSREVMKEWFNTNFSKFSPEASRLSIGQQQLLKEATARAANLDIKLRTSMQELMGTSPEAINIRTEYGVPDPTKPMSKQDALAYLIVGRTESVIRSSGDPTSVENTIRYALANLFYSKKQKENVFDLFSGIDISRETSPLTSKGKQTIDSLVDAYAPDVYADPTRLWATIADIQKEYAALVALAKSGDPLAKDLFNDVGDIVDIVKDGKARTFGGGAKPLVGESAKLIPQEVSVALYYRAEAAKIQNEMLSDLVSKEIGKGSIRLGDSMNPNDFRAASNALASKGIQIFESEHSLIMNRIKAMLTNPDWRNAPITENDIIEAFLAQSTVSRRLAKENAQLVRKARRDSIYAEQRIVAERDAALASRDVKLTDDIARASDQVKEAAKSLQRRLGLNIDDTISAADIRALDAQWTTKVQGIITRGKLAVQAQLDALPTGPSNLRTNLEDQLARLDSRLLQRANASANLEALLGRSNKLTSEAAAKAADIRAKAADKVDKEIRASEQKVNRLSSRTAGPRSKLREDLATRGAADDLAKAQDLMRDPQFMSVVDDLMERSQDAASTIVRQNGLKEGVSLDDIEKSLKNVTGLFGSNKEADKLKLLFGTDVAKQIQENISTGFSSLKEQLKNELVRGYEGRGSLTAVKDTMLNLWDTINNIRYTLLLNARPRFHGANLATGADIVYQTTGKLPNYVDVSKGLLLTHTASNSPSKIMLRDAAGRSYTAKEIYDILAMQGGKSVYKITAPSLASKRILGLTDPDYKAFTDWWYAIGEAPQIEDMGYRYSVFADAIRSGRSADEAVALARKAMFDAADLTSLERPIQQLLMFYGFARNNFVNFAKNMASTEGRNRILTFLRAERDVNSMTTTPEEREFAPGYTQTKTIFNVLPYGEKELYLTSPSLATKEAVRLLGEMIRGNIGDVAASMLNPSYKEILGLQSPMDRDPKKILPEHILYMNAIPLSSPGDIASAIAGSEIVPRRATPEEGAVNGYIYPLTTPEQVSRYKKFIDTVNYVGLSTPTNDWSKLISGEGTPVQALSLPERLAYGAGLVTPSASVPAWRQDYYNKLGKLKALKEATSTMAYTDIKEKAVQAPMTPEEAAMAEKIVVVSDAKKSIRQEAYDQLPEAELTKRALQLRAELQREIRAPYTVMGEQYGGNRQQFLAEWVAPRKAELDKIVAELMRRKGTVAPSSKRATLPKSTGRPKRLPRPPRK